MYFISMYTCRIFDKCVWLYFEPWQLFFLLCLPFVCLCVRSYIFIGFYLSLQPVRHKSLHHYKFHLPCPIDCHCVGPAVAQLGSRQAQVRRPERSLFVCRVRFMCTFHTFIAGQVDLWKIFKCLCTIIAKLGRGALCACLHPVQ